MEAAAAVECEVRATGSARDAACLPSGMVGELRRKLGPIALAVVLLFMGVGIMNIRVSAEFPCSRQRAAWGKLHRKGREQTKSWEPEWQKPSNLGPGAAGLLGPWVVEYKHLWKPESKDTAPTGSAADPLRFAAKFAVSIARGGHPHPTS